MGIILAVITLFGVIAVLGDSDNQTADEGDRVGAALTCEKFVKDRLKAPASAGFPTVSGQTIVSTGNRWKVESHVDADNGFGANVRTEYVCVVTYEGDGSWRLQQMDMQSR